jgi:hypothetical protein
MTNAIGIRPAGSAVHGLVMEGQGPRPRMVRLEIRGDGTVRRRFTVAEGLTITDLSTNGTTLILQGGRRRLNLRRHTQPFTVGDEAVIVPGLEIVRSGRQYPSELRSPPRLSGRRQEPSIARRRTTIR